MKAARVLMSLVLWAVAGVAIAASTVQGHALLVQKKDFSQWETWVFPAAIEAAVAAVVAGSQAAARCNKRWPWGVVLRVLTVSLSLVLNATEPVRARDWLSAGLHIAVPVLVYVLVEASAEFLRMMAPAEATDDPSGRSSAQLDNGAGEEAVPAPEADLEVVRAVATAVLELAKDQRSVSRDAVAEKVRKAGVSASTERLTAAWRLVLERPPTVLNGLGGGGSNGLHAGSTAG